jgi:hypothetical protein
VNTLAKNKDARKPKQTNFAGGNGNPSPSMNVSQKSTGVAPNPATPNAK